DLPADLAPLARCQYRRLRYRDASADLARLVGELTTTNEDTEAAARRQRDAVQQLPAGVTDFAGRVSELAASTGLLRSRADTDLPSGPRPEPASFLIRVRTASGQVAGLGALVGHRKILTCAHVVNAALGRDLRAQERPEEVLAIDCPLLSECLTSRARVVQWLPPPREGVTGDDIAGLLLDEDPPPGAEPVRLVSEPPRPGQVVDVFGYPREPQRENGVWVEV